MVTLDLKSAHREASRAHFKGDQASAFVQLGLLDLVRFPVATAATLTLRAQTARPRRLRRVLSSGAVYDILSGDPLRRSRSRAAVSQFACERWRFLNISTVRIKRHLRKSNWLPDLALS